MHEMMSHIWIIVTLVLDGLRLQDAGSPKVWVFFCCASRIHKHYHQFHCNGCLIKVHEKTFVISSNTTLVWLFYEATSALGGSNISSIFTLKTTGLTRMRITVPLGWTSCRVGNATSRSKTRQLESPTTWTHTSITSQNSGGNNII